MNKLIPLLCFVVILSGCHENKYIKKCTIVHGHRFCRTYAERSHFHVKEYVVKNDDDDGMTYWYIYQDNTSTKNVGYSSSPTPLASYRTAATTMSRTGLPDNIQQTLARGSLKTEKEMELEEEPEQVEEVDEAINEAVVEEAFEAAEEAAAEAPDTGADSESDSSSSDSGSDGGGDGGDGG